MSSAWYIVEVFCAFAIYRAIVGMLNAGDRSMLLAIQLLFLLLTFILSAWALLGSRVSRRILAVLIIGNAAYIGWQVATGGIILPLSLAVWILLVGYFAVGAVKLWHVAELHSQGGGHA